MALCSGLPSHFLPLLESVVISHQRATFPPSASCQFSLTRIRQERWRPGEGGCFPRAIINCVCSTSMCIFICAFISILNGAIKLLYDLASGQISIEFHNQSLCSCIYGKVGGGVVLFQIFVSPKWLLILFGRQARVHVKGWEQEWFLSSDRDQDLLFHNRVSHILKILTWRKVKKTAEA